MTLSRHFYRAALSGALIAGATCGGYHLADQGYGLLAATPAPVMDDAARARATDYHKRFMQLTAMQQALTLTTDEEDAAYVLFEAKRSFATAAILDRQLAEADLGVIARNFNTISTDDGIRFRAYAYDPAAIARRNECLDITPATHEKWGNDAYAYAQRVESCMIRMTDDTPAIQTAVARMGGAAGGGMAVAFLLGGALRRRSVAPAAG